MRHLIFALLLFASHSLISQITLGIETLPDFDEVLEYDSFDEYQGDSFKDTGADMTWSFSDFDRGLEVTERYKDINSTIYADSFPDANMIVSVGPFEAGAIRSDEGIAIIGLTDIGFGGINIGSSQIEDPYFLRQVPMAFGDEITDEFDIEISLPASAIPGVEMIPIPIPGATLDSLRLNITTYKKESASGWGSLTLENEEYNVLKIDQIDSTGVQIEAQLNLFGAILWVDVTDLLGDMASEFGLGSGSTFTHKFVSAEHKYSLVEFVETQELDTLGVVIGTSTNGRLGKVARPVAIQNLASPAAQIKLYPNPVNDILYIQATASNVTFNRVYTIEGALVKRLTGSQQSEIHTSMLDDGMYILESSDGRRSYYSKFVVKR